MNKIILAAALMMLAWAEGQAAERQTDFKLRRHEFALGVNWVPVQTMDGATFSYGFDKPSIGSIYEAAEDYMRVVTSGSWSFSYGYNFNRIFTLGALFSYEGVVSQRLNKPDDSVVFNNYEHHFTVLPVARFNWLNRPWFRMYSSVGVGVRRFYSCSHEWRQYKWNDTMIAAQLVPVGISFGGKFFGYAEAGVGTIYIGLSIGIGYRF